MDDRTPRIAHEILAYLAEHPDAQDTLEGIAEWWLLERCIRRRLDEVQEAIGVLVSEGLVTERIQADAQPRYQVNPQRLPQIEELLEHDERDGRRGTGLTARHGTDGETRD